MIYHDISWHIVIYRDISRYITICHDTIARGPSINAYLHDMQPSCHGSVGLGHEVPPTVTDISLSTCTSTCAYMSMYLDMYIYTQVRNHPKYEILISTKSSEYVYVYICIYVYLYMYVYIYMYVYMCMYMYTRRVASSLHITACI